MRDLDPARANTIFEVLSHHRRRSALRVLHRYETPITLADLADEVAVREYDRPIADIDPDDVKRVYMSLYHSHLPKLVSADIVEYDQDRDMVRLTGDEDEWWDILDGVSPLAESDTERGT